jgi:hypothetical protein
MTLEQRLKFNLERLKKVDELIKNNPHRKDAVLKRKDIVAEIEELELRVNGSSERVS